MIKSLEFNTVVEFDNANPLTWPCHRFTKTGCFRLSYRKKMIFILVFTKIMEIFKTEMISDISDKYFTLNIG